jgi:hypothetical protein
MEAFDVYTSVLVVLSAALLLAAAGLAKSCSSGSALYRCGCENIGGAPERRRRVPPTDRRRPPGIAKAVR